MTLAMTGMSRLLVGRSLVCRQLAIELGGCRISNWMLAQSKYQQHGRRSLIAAAMMESMQRKLGFGWTNGVVLWVASTFDELP